MFRRVHLVVALAVLAILCLVAPPRVIAAPDDEGSVRIHFPHDDSADVGLKCGKVELTKVKLDNTPSERDVHKARHHKDDTTTLKWIFSVDNDGKHKRKVTIHITVYAEDGDVLADETHDDTISGKTEHDHMTVRTKIHTYKYPDAHHVRISAECERD
jgi:hypothetical protein